MAENNPFTSGQAPPIQAWAIAPEIAAQQQSLMRKQALAQFLLQQGMKENDGSTQVINGWAVKKSPLEGIGKMAALLGGTMMQRRNDAENAKLSQQYAAALNSQIDGSTPGSATQPTPSNEIQVGQDGAPMAPQEAQPQAQQQATQAMDLRSRMLRASAISQVYGKDAGEAFLRDTAKTDLAKNNEYLGIDKSVASSLELAKRRSEGILGMKGGTTYRDLTTGSMFTAPTIPENSIVNWDAKGNPVVSALPGASDVVAGSAAAKLRGENTQTLAPKEALVMNPDGTMQPTTISNVISGYGSGQPGQSNPQPGNVLNPSGLQLNGKLIDNLIMAESSGNPNAVNPTTNATGLGQFIPSTTKMLNDKGYKFDPRNPEQSRAAINDYLVSIIKGQGGDINNPEDVKRGLAVYGGFKTKDPSSYQNKIMNGVQFESSGKSATTPLAFKPQGVGEPFGLRETIEGQAKTAKTTYDKLVAQNEFAPTITNALDNLEKHSGGAITGTLNDQRAFVAGIGSLIPGWRPGMDAKTETELLDKASARLSLGMSSGAQATDALRALTQAASPNSKMTKDAIRGAINEIRPLIKMQLAQQAVMDRYQVNNDFKGANSANLEFQKNADPRIWQLESMAPNKQLEYIKKLPPAEAAALLQKRKAIKAMGGM